MDCLIPNQILKVKKKFNLQLIAIKLTLFFTIFEEKKGEGKGEREFPSEALSFPAAGSLKRQLVSPKRGRAGNNGAVQVKSHLTLPVSVFLL